MSETAQTEQSATSAPAERPAPAAPVAPTGVLTGTFWQALPFFLGAVLIGLASGLGQGFVTGNISQLAGDLHVTPTEASWLMVVYMVPRSTLPLILTKFRNHYGLLLFSKISILFYLMVSIFGLGATDFRAALIYMALAGCAWAPLSTLTFLYFLEPFQGPAKLQYGLPLTMVVVMAGPNLARVISPSLIGDGGFTGVHIATLGLAVIAFAVIWFLRIAQQPTAKSLQIGDFVTVGLLLVAISCLTTAFVMGPIHWWTEVAWLGWIVALALIAMTLCIMVEINRKSPLIDFRWLASPAMLHFSGALILFRLLLSEQSAGAPRMFQTLGVGANQLELLFAVIVLFTLLGALACVAWFKLPRLPQFHMVALMMIAAGCYMDSFSTVDTRPHQFLISQAMIGFAGMLFMPPAMAEGLVSSMKKGPNYILSFIVVFIATQSLGGVLGSGLFSTIVNQRTAFHLQTLTEQMMPTAPATQSAIAQGMARLSTTSADALANRGQGVTEMMTSANMQATVMAFNDAYFLSAIVALIALAILVLHILYDGLKARMSPAAPSPSPV